MPVFFVYLCLHLLLLFFKLFFILRTTLHRGVSGLAVGLEIFTSVRLIMFTIAWAMMIFIYYIYNMFLLFLLLLGLYVTAGCVKCSIRFFSRYWVDLQQKKMSLFSKLYLTACCCFLSACIIEQSQGCSLLSCQCLCWCIQNGMEVNACTSSSSSAVMWHHYLVILFSFFRQGSWSTGDCCGPNSRSHYHYAGCY